MVIGILKDPQGPPDIRLTVADPNRARPGQMDMMLLKTQITRKSAKSPRQVAWVCTIRLYQQIWRI